MIWGKRQAYVVIAANVDKLPEMLPGWLIEIVDGMARVKDALFDAEQAASVVMGGDSTDKEKADRCARIFEQFIGEHGHGMTEHAKAFSRRRDELPPAMVKSFGADVALLALCVMNAAFRSRTLRELALSWPEGEAQACVQFLRVLAEHCPGQGLTLDWMRVSLLGEGATQTDEASA